MTETAITYSTIIEILENSRCDNSEINTQTNIGQILYQTFYETFDLSDTKSNDLFRKWINYIFIAEDNNLANEILKYMSPEQSTSETETRRAKFSQDVKKRDSYICRITGLGTELPVCEAAHILPFSKCQTDEDKYNSDNGITLFREIHHGWDQGYIISIPNTKKSTVEFRLNDNIGLTPEQFKKNIVSLTKPVIIPVNQRMLYYFIRRYELDNCLEPDTCY